MADQVVHKVALLRHVALLPGRPPLLVVAHSIGAAMMLRAIAKVESFDLECIPAQEAKPPPTADCTGRAGAAAAVGAPAIINLVALFPFLEAVPESNPRQAAIRRVASWHGRLGWLGDLLATLPRALLARCLRMGSGMAADTAEAIAARLNRSTLRNALYLAADEFKLVSGLGHRLHVMGCDEDTWLSRAQFEELRQRVPGLQATWHAELRHDFCVSAAQSRAVAEHVSGIARSGLAQLPDGGWKGGEQRAAATVAAKAGNADVGREGLAPAVEAFCAGYSAAGGGGVQHE